MELARYVVISAAVLVLAHGAAVRAQFGPGQPSVMGNQNRPSPMQQAESEATSQKDTETELQAGTSLTRQGRFEEAIPHLLAAQGRALHEYAADFDLALCYLGVRKYQEAIQILNNLRSGGHDGADVENLFAQAYVGSEQPREALASLERAAALSPQNERPYVFVIDACMDRHNYALGLKVANLGLRNLPRSARLHYQKAVFLLQLDEPDQAKQEFATTSRLAPGSELGYLAAAHEELANGKIPEAIQSARQGIRSGFGSHALSTILGEALIRSGATPGQAEFVEAQTALEKSVADQPNDAVSQLSLGNLYLMSGHIEDAIAHLERAGKLEPDATAVYASLAKAYRLHGETRRAQDVLAVLEKLNQEEADRINSAPGDRKLGYVGRTGAEESPPQP